MINNNPYNIPEKKPLSQSRIFSQTNTSRHSSTYLQNRNSNEIMYNSSIFLKNSSIMNGPSDKSFFEPVKQPLSPHSKFPKPSSNVQFITTSYNHNHVLPQENFTVPITTPKDNESQRLFTQLKSKIETMQKRLELQQKRQSGQGSSKQFQSIPQSDSLRSLIEDQLSMSTSIKQMIRQTVQQSLNSQTSKIRQKMQQFEQILAFSNFQSFIDRLDKVEELLPHIQTDKPHDQHVLARIKTIQKTIRQMGEDIHLVNDKEQNLSAKIETELPFILNQIKSLRNIEIKPNEQQRKTDQIREQIQLLTKKVKFMQTNTQQIIANRLKQIDSKLRQSQQKLKTQQQRIENLVLLQQKSAKTSYQRYFSQPIILKYIQKFQVKVSHSSNTKHIQQQNSDYQQIIFNQITYFIDHEGFLLDNDRYYLTHGTKNQRIKLDLKHIDLLKQNRILI